MPKIRFLDFRSLTLKLFFADSSSTVHIYSHNLTVILGARSPPGTLQAPGVETMKEVYSLSNCRDSINNYHSLFYDWRPLVRCGSSRLNRNINVYSPQIRQQHKNTAAQA